MKTRGREESNFLFFAVSFRIFFSTADDIRYYRLRYYKQSFRNAFLCVTSNAFWRKEEKAGERRKVVLNKVCAEKHEKVAVSRDLIGDKERTSAGLIGKVSF